tara:strand:- start:7155 stop:8153 length:999 start_codon:yes stop_codon:yes gene_type:complete
MAVEETRVRQPEFIEQRSEQLLKSVFGDPDAVKQAGESDSDFNLRKFGLSGVSQPVPGQQIANFSPDQLQAFQNIRGGIGAFQPELTAATDAAAAATGTGVLAGQTLAGAQQAFDPSTGISPFMNQYNDFVIDEIRKQGDIARNRLRGQATKAGAFGGSRAAIQEAELDKGIASQVGLAQQRAFDSALKAAMGSQEAQQRRQLAAGQQLGNLARTQGGLAGVFGALGQLDQSLNLRDQQALLGVGQAQQQLQQAGLDVGRRNLITAQQEPFRRMQFASDILRGVPSGQTTFRDVPDSNPLLEYAGLGIAGISALGAFGDAFPNNSFVRGLNS